MARFSEWIKNRDKEEDKRSSSPYSKNDYARYRAEKAVGVDTFETDLNDVNSRLSSVLGGWQTQETLENTRSAVENMYKRANDYQNYVSKYQPDAQTNISEISSYYKSVLDNWDSMSEAYGYYKDADSYSRAIARQKFASDENFQNLSYDKVQEMLKQYSPDSDEYRYLSSYTGYKDLKDFDKALRSGGGRSGDGSVRTSKGPSDEYREELERARNIHALDNKFDLYSDIMQNEDYAENSQYKSTQAQKKLLGMEYTDYGDETYEYINNVNDARNMLIAKYQEGNGATELENHGYEHMTKDEIGVFNYLYAQDKEQAYKYLEDLETSLNKRTYETSTEKWKEIADKHDNLAWDALVSIPTFIYNQAGGIGNIIASADEAIKGKEYNPYSPLRTPSNATADIRQYVSENMDERYDGKEFLGTNAPSFLYQNVMSTGDSLIGATMFGKASSVIMASNAFQQTAKEMTEQGEDTEKALLLGGVSGLAELAFEYAGLDHMFNIKDADSVKSVIVSALKQAGAEGLEEIGTEIVNILSDTLIRGDHSELMSMAQELRDRGFSETEINAEIAKRIASQIGLAGIGGMLSGSVMGGMFAGNQYHNLNSTGKQIASNERTQDMVELAGLTDKESETYKLYTEYANKGINAENITPARLGNLRTTLENESYETLRSKKTTNEQKLKALEHMDELSKVDTAKSEDEKVVAKVTEEAKQQAQETQTKVAEMVQAEGREDISFYSQSMEQAKAEAFNSIYDGKADMEAYANSFELAYTYGKNKIGLSEALKHKGVLTESQALKAYEAGNVGRALEKQKIVDEINKKHSGKTFIKGKFDDGIIDYNGNAEGKVAWKDLGASRQNAIKFLRAFAEVTGVNVKLITSTVNEQGKRIGENGRYEASTNTIYIDAYAGSMDASVLNDAIVPTVSHEVTHWMKAKAPAMYQKMQDYVLETLTLDGKKTLNEMIAEEKARMKQAHPNQKVTDENAIDELVARGTEDMLANSDKVRKMLAKMSKTEQDSFIAKVKETFQNIIDWVNDLLKQYQSGSKEAEILREYKERMKKLSKMWDSALTEAIQTNQSMQAEGIKNDIELLKKNGVLANEENATVYSVRYLLDEDKKNKVASDLVKVLGVSKEKAMEYLNAETSIASLVLNPKHQEFLDYEADDNEVAIKKNSDYPQGTVDFSNICAKRRDFTSVMNRVMSKFKDHIFMSTDLAKIRTIMSEEKITIPCGICYVEDRRQLDSIVAEDFLMSLDLYRSGSKTRPDGKPFNANQLKALKMVENDKYTPSIYELITLEGRNALKTKDANMENAWVTYNNARGMQSVRLLTNEAEYKREILNYSPAEVKRKNDLGGLRIYSFSDAEIPHLIDLVQVIMDSASKGLSIQGYTKVNWYARMIRDTGVKLSRSLIPAGELGYHIENGKVVLDLDTVEGIDIYDEDFFDSTDYDDIGNILIGINEVQIRTAMLDPFIDYIIPFHTGQSGDVLKEKGIDKWQNYKDFQSERNISDGKKSAKQINIYTDVIQKLEAEGTPLKDKVQFVEKFLSVCKENGLIPRFSEFLNTDENGDYIYTEGYHKLIIDFKTFHPVTGEYLPQMPVKPIFDNAFITKTLKEFAKQEKAKQAELQPKMDKAVARIEEEVIGTQFSDRTQYADRNNFSDVIDQWRKDGRPEGMEFILGSTGDVLQGLGAIESDIYMLGDKIEKILEDHPEMTFDEIKKIPQILENPIMVLKSKGNHPKVILFGSAKAKNGKPILTVLDLRPTENGFVLDDMQKVGSAYTKTATHKLTAEENGMEFLKSSEILYAEKNKTTNLLTAIGFSKPITYNHSGFIGSITYEGTKINIEGKRFDEVVVLGGEETEQYSDRVFDVAENIFGTTTNFEEAGYILPNGKMLKFTSENNLGERAYDHRAIAMAYGVDVDLNVNHGFSFENGKYLDDFVENGGVRLDSGNLELATDIGLQLSSNIPITKEQERTIRDLVEWEKEREELFESTTSEDDRWLYRPLALRVSFGGDSSNAGGSDSIKNLDAKNTKYLNYEGGNINADRIISDIRRYYQTGELREQSKVAMFHTQYSDRDYTSVYELMGEKETLDEENRKLKADIERLKATIGTEDVKITRFRSLADYLKKQAGSNYSRETLGDALKELYNYIQTTEDLKWYNVMAKAEEIANDMMNLNVPINYFREVMNDIRQDKITLSPEQMAEAEKLYGYGNLHKALFGRVNLTKNGRLLEEQWKDWAKAFPTVFKSDISATDMVNELRDIVDALKNTSAVMGEYERQEAIRHMGMEIYNQFWNIASDPSDAVRKERVAHREMMEEMRKNYQKRQAEKTLHPEGELALKYEKILKETIKRDRDEMQRIRELGKKRIDSQKERAERNTLIQRITTKSMTLNKWLLTNSKKEHVPDALKPVVMNFLNSIDFSSKRYLEQGVPTKKDEQFAKALSKLHRMMQNSNKALGSADGANDYIGAFFPDSLVQEIGELVERVENYIPEAQSGEYVLNQMTVADLKVLDYLLSVLKSSVVNMNEFLETKHKEGIADLSQGGMAYRNKLGTAKEYTGVRQWIQKTFNWNNVNPFHAFKRFGEDARKIFTAMQDGWDKFAFNVNKIVTDANKIYDKKEIIEWRKVIKKDIEISGGRKVTMTIPQIMSLYELQKREQARKHIIGDGRGKGIRVGDIEDGKNIIRQTNGTGQLTQDDIDKITGLLTARQKEVADKLQAFMNDVCAKWGNEVTMKLYGFSAFEEANYFPIKTDDNVHASEPTDNENTMFRLLNMSFTKSVNENANNRIMVLDIFDVFAQHASDMAKYNALALPVYDAFRWYSYKENTDDNTFTVKTSLETAFGKDGKGYVYTFLKDLNGTQNVGRDAIGTKFFTNAKIASVGMNLKVMALQPTSYVRAGAVLDPKYLAIGLAKKADFEKVKEYCGIAVWKSLGFYDTNIQRGVAELIKHDTTWKDEVVEFSMKGAEKMDEITLGKLWNACEAEVKDKRKDLGVGTDEFYKAVGLRLRDVIYNTQVVDSTMTRSQMMRSADGMDKMATSFMSEPTLAYNMLHDAYMDFVLSAKETGSKKTAFQKHGNRMARVFTAYTVTNLVTALVEAGFDGFRDDEDELTAEEFLKMFLQNFGADMGVLGKVPYVKEIVSLFQGYSSSRMDTQWARYASYTASGIGKLLEGKGNAYTTANNALRAFAYATGLPFYNIYRDFVATMDTTGLISAEELEEMFNEVFGDIYPSLRIK